MKRLIALLLVILTLCLAGCGGKEQAVEMDVQAVYESMEGTLPEMLVMDEAMMLNFCGIKSEQGLIAVSGAVFTTITGMAATNCFGVKGMAYRSMTDGLVHLLRREAMSKGVNITYHDDNSISIELHIIVENGVNLPAVCRSIMNEVRYVVTKNTGVTVKSVDVRVDSMTL